MAAKPAARAGQGAAAARGVLMRRGPGVAAGGARRSLSEATPPADRRAGVFGPPLVAGAASRAVPAAGRRARRLSTHQPGSARRTYLPSRRVRTFGVGGTPFAPTIGT